MKVIIFEGIATSGKTTVSRLLCDAYSSSGRRALVIDEDQTLMPVIEDWTRQKNVEQCLAVIRSFQPEDYDLVIIDRLYFSHIFRTDSSEADFSVVTEALEALRPLFVLLTVEEGKIEERIFESIKHRDASWAEFVWKKGKSWDEVVEYYRAQQQWYLGAFAKTKFDNIVVDTTNQNFSEATENILAL